jgi:DNA-binding SARP family transcriptional activator
MGPVIRPKTGAGAGDSLGVVATSFPGIHLHLLGPMQALRGDRSLVFRTRKALALLAYLAVEGGLHRREELAYLLWPGTDAQAGRASLRTALFYVRDALGGDAEAMLSTTREHVGVRQGAPLHLDLDDLAWAQRLLRDASGAMGLTPQVAGALAGYRGSFLAGVAFPDAPDFEAWMEAQRAHWQDVVSELLCGLAHVHAEAGDWVCALTALERLTAWNPADEPGWRSLLELHLLRKDASAARRTWRAYLSAVADLEARPSPEMLEVAERISPSDRGRPAGVSGALDDPGQSLHRCPPFVGRAGEWSRLHAAFERVRSGRTELVVLAGGPGMGKTRLGAEFAGSARRVGADVLAGRELEVSGELPCAAPAGALRARLEEENAPEDLLSDVWLSELSRMLPELRERYPDLAEPRWDQALQPTLLFEAIVRLGQALARRKPLLLWLDDVQWAGAATRDLLRYAVRRWSESGTGVLVLLSAGSRELDADGELRRWLAALGRDARSCRLEVGPLARDDLVQLASILTAGPAAPRALPGAIAFGEWLDARTGGLPGRIGPVLSRLFAEGALRLRSADGSGWAVDVGTLPDGTGGRTTASPPRRHLRLRLAPESGAHRRSRPQPPRGAVRR